MKWSELTPDQRNRLIQEKVFGETEEPCLDGQIDIYMGAYWRCSCGWISDQVIGEPGSTEGSRNRGNCERVVVCPTNAQFTHHLC